MASSNDSGKPGSPAGAARGGTLPLVLLPGTLCDERVFSPLIERLTGRDCDVRLTVGHRSTPEMATALLADLPPLFALGGFSLGGIVALEMIAQAPERVAALALVDTTPRPDPEPNRTARREAVARARRAGIATHVAAELWPVSVADHECASRAHRDLIIAMATALGLETFDDQSEMAINRADSRPRLASIAVPTLVLCGAKDQLCTPDIHRDMAAAIPGARLAVIEDAGHFALIERPDAVAAAFCEWLVRADEHTTKETVA
jgi:pimeloyl-ACP methyl ester carboxylesterase